MEYIRIRGQEIAVALFSDTNNNSFQNTAFVV